MKTVLRAGCVCLFVLTTALAGPLQRPQVSAEAKWLLHLDVENLLRSKVGGYIGKELVDPKLAEGTNNLKQQLDIDFNWRCVQGVTLYGWDFKPPGKDNGGHGVLLIKADMDVGKALESVTTKLSIAMGENAPLAKTQDAPFPVFTIKKEVLVAVPAGKPVVIARFKEDLDRAMAVLDGKSPSLEGKKELEVSQALTPGFFFFGAAEGFNELAPIPPQAKVLKMAESVQLTAGERDEALRVSLGLTAKTAEVSQQIQQVVQGIVAVVALGQSDNAELQTLAQGIKVNCKERQVAVEVQYPVSKALDHLAKEAKKEKKEKE